MLAWQLINVQKNICKTAVALRQSEDDAGSLSVEKSERTLLSHEEERVEKENIYKNALSIFKIAEQHKINS